MVAFFRGVAGVIVGYILVAILMFAVLAGAWVALGADAAFQPGTYQTSMLWSLIMLVVGFVVAILGGWVCALIGGSRTAGYVFAALVLIVGLGGAGFEMMKPAGEMMERGGDVGMLAAMQHAKTPMWVLLLNPIVGAAGVFLGARLTGGKKGQAPAAPAEPMP